MVKTLLNEVKEYKKDTLLSPIYVSIEAILEVFIPFLMALLVDNGIEKGNMGSIWFYGTLMLVAPLYLYGLVLKVESMRQSHRVVLRRI